MKDQVLGFPFFFLVLSIVFFGCQKESSTDLLDNQPVHPREATDFVTDLSDAELNIIQYMTCYNQMAAEIDAKNFEHNYGSLNAIRIIYTDKSGREAVVFPLLLEEQVASFLVANEDGVLFQLQEVAELSEKDVESTGLSRHLAKLFGTANYLKDDTQLETIKNVLASDYTTQIQQDFVFLQEKSHIGQGENPPTFNTGKLSALCEDGIYLMLPFYADLFGLPLQEPYDFTDQIFDAILSCHPSGPYCVCPIPTCVLESLINTVDDDLIADQLKLKYIELDLHLSEAETAWLSNYLFLTLDLYETLSQNQAGDACSTSLNDYSIFQDVITTCAQAGCTESEFYAQLTDSYDYIEETSSFTDNAKIKCIWDKLNDAQNTLLCATLGNFMDTPDYDLRLYVGNHPQQCGRTLEEYPTGSGIVAISFDVACIDDRSEIELAKTILHEGIHAEVYRVIQDLEGNLIDPEDEPYIWEQYRNHKNWQHEYMANYYLDALADALSEYDDATYSMEHYRALAWQGLDEYDSGHPITQVWDGLSTNEQNTILALRAQVVAGSPTDCE